MTTTLKCGACVVLLPDRRLSAQSTADDVRSAKVVHAFVGGRQVTP